MQQHQEEYRLLINVALQRIPGNPCSRPFTLGDAFSQQFHGRNLRLNDGRGAFDGVHIPGDVDSELNVKRWFLFDVGVTRALDREELKEVPLAVFTADYIAEEERWVFRPRDMNLTALAKYVAMFKWGAGEEMVQANQGTED